MELRRWIAETLGLAVGFGLALAVAGPVAVGVGMPIAWAVDRARADWSAEVLGDRFADPVEDDPAAAGSEGDGSYLLPSYEMRPATPADLAAALQ